MMVKDYHRLLGLTVKNIVFFIDRSTKEAELHYYCAILNKHM